jgi:hypothetical protein
MGFIVEYKYHKLIEGQYDKEQKFGDMITVGKPYEDVSLDVLAGKIMALMARRNVLVVEVEVYELVRKQLAFKEQEDCIVIKNKKFKFDDGPAIEGVEIQRGPAEGTQQPIVHAHNEVSRASLNPNISSDGQVNNNQPERPMKIMYFNPDDPYWINFTRQKIPDLPQAFTVGKRYPIFEQKDQIVGKDEGGNPAIGIFYRTTDNMGRTQWINDVMFTLDESKGVGNLGYGNEVRDNVPILRR